MPKSSARAPAHQIGALPWRRRDGVLEVLLVTSRETRRWVIPKGWPMTGRSDPEAAAAEAWEEAGLKGLIVTAPIGAFNYDKRLKDGEFRECRVKVYPFEVTAERDQWPESGQRERLWVARDEAATLVQEPGLAKIIARFTPD
ncbi:MAG: NUDIX domain-containing protein [Caulobacter sp.]|nr:NUDIX domain-containing protein [Caulobacter sp.]